MTGNGLSTALFSTSISRVGKRGMRLGTGKILLLLNIQYRAIYLSPSLNKACKLGCREAQFFAIITAKLLSPLRLIAGRIESTLLRFLASTTALFFYALVRPIARHQVKLNLTRHVTFVN